MQNKNETNLRELFLIIGYYKWSIIFFTLLLTFSIAIKVYFMPKYYKSTVTLEVKPKDDKAGGFSMGGAAALLLGGGSSASSNLDKDITLLKTYRTNKKVLDNVKGYMIRYFITDKQHKEIEIENNISIEVTDVKIHHFKDYGLKLIIKPLNKTEYMILKPGRFSNTPLGKYHYSEIVKNEKFSLMIHKKKDYIHKTYTIQLSGTKRYIYKKIIKENLTIKADKKSPFLTLSFTDNLPQRGERYLKELIAIYTEQSINDSKEDALILINSYQKQLKKVEANVQSSSHKLENFKTQNGIISPKLQSASLIKELSNVGIEIAQNRYKQELLQNLINFVKKHENIDAIAPSLIELQDQPTISLIKLIQTQQILLADLLVKYKVNHPDIIRANQTIYTLKDKVLSNLENLKSTLKDKTKSLQKMEKNYNQKLQSSPKQEQELIAFSRDYEINEKMYLYLMQERSVAQLQYDKALSRFKVIEPIYTDNNPVKPKKALIVIVAFVTILILMIFISFFREFMKPIKEKK